MSQDRPPTPPFGRLVKLQQGYEMHYLEHGSGPPVVFVHGSGPGVNAYSNFFPNYRVIAAAGYRCLMPDMIGFGWSSKPDGIDYTLELFVPTLCEFLDQLEIERCVLVGNSLGGAISMKLAIDHPERVEKLIVMGPGGIESRETYFKMPGIQKMVSQFVGSGFDRAGAAPAARTAGRTIRSIDHRRAGRAALQHSADAAQGRAGAHVDPRPHPRTRARCAVRCSASGASRISSAPRAATRRSCARCPTAASSCTRAAATGR